VKFCSNFNALQGKFPEMGGTGNFLPGTGNSFIGTGNSNSLIGVMETIDWFSDSNARIHHSVARAQRAIPG
jgi:hypothetical protein